MPALLNPSRFAAPAQSVNLDTEIAADTPYLWWKLDDTDPATPTNYAGDTFTRADSATTLGTTELGSLAWAAVSGTWGISSNRAYLVSGSSGSQAHIDVGHAEYAITVTCAVTGLGGVLFRMNSAGTQGWFFNFGRQSIYTLNSGFFEKTANLGAAASGDVFRIEVFSNGATVVYKNGSSVPLVGYSESWQLANTRVGFLADNSTPRFDGLTVESVAYPTAADASGNGRAGAYNAINGMSRGVSSIIPNVVSACVDPNATSGNYISRASTDLTGSDITYEMWVRGDAWPAGAPKGLFQYGAEIGVARAGDVGKRSGQIQWYMGTNIETDASDDLAVGHTYHLVFTYNTTSGAMGLWINGVLVKTGTGSTARFSTSQTHYVGFNNAAGREPDAKIQYASAFKTLLSQARIYAHWKAGANDKTAAPQPVGTERYQTGTAATSHAVPVPYGVQAGDNLVMVVAAAATAACTGWTASETGTAGNGFTVNATLLTKVADSTDAANAGTGTWSVTMGSSRAAITVSAYRGGTIGDSNVSTASSATSIAGPTVTCGASARIVHGVAAVTQSGAGYVLSPSTSTAHRRSALAAFHTSAVSDEYKSSAGTSTARTHGASGSSGLVAFAISLDA